MGEAAEEKLKDLDKKLDVIMKRLDTIEEILLLYGEYPYLAAAVRSMRRSVAFYSEPIKALQRLSTARSFLRRRATSKDELSQTIIGILAGKGPLNISQVTRAVRAVKGKASRRIVRERLKRLEEQGVVHLTEGWGRRYEVAEGP